MDLAKVSRASAGELKLRIHIQSAFENLGLDLLKESLSGRNYFQTIAA